MSDDRSEQQGRIWLDRGVAAARAGRRAEAREALFRALNYEGQREMAWLWLAAVADDRHQEQMYLNKVLALNPDNPHARAGLAQLEKNLQEERASADEKPSGQGHEAVVASASPAGGEPRPPEKTQQAGPKPKQQALPASPGVEAPKPVSEASPPKPPPVARPSAQGKPATAATDKPVSPGPPLPQPGNKQVVTKGTGQPQGAVVAGEASGWTTQSAPVRPPASSASSPEPSGWTRAEPKLGTAVARPARPPQPRVEAVSYEMASPPMSRGGLAGAVSEAFGSHEIWTALLAMAGLVALAMFMAVILFLYGVS